MLAGCGGSQSLIGAPGTIQQTQPIPLGDTLAGRAQLARSLRVVHAFGHGSDGRNPAVPLIDVDGTLYGTTDNGGVHGYGTVYRISPGGSEKVLYSFAGRTGSSIDGANPGRLIDVDGTLYGTTLYGGDNGFGTVYRITMSGQEHVLHSFGGAHDGASPVGALIDVKGMLYGTTTIGGSGSCYSDYGCGTMYTISKAGKEHVLYNFDRTGDGASPTAGLLDVNGTLYGTTYLGGERGLETIYRISTNGSEKVLYSFAGDMQGRSDGSFPSAGLIDVKGTLYGTTSAGGAYSDNGGAGTVFSVTTGGKEHVLHSFGGAHDGSYPSASLLDVKGTLYGTAANGKNRGGTLFTITTGGEERVLFKMSRADGWEPSGLIDVNGTLYGAAAANGHYLQGTVFALKP